VVVRMWHGRVSHAKARAYREFLNSRAISDYRATPGNLGVYVLERVAEDAVHFVTLTYWVDWDSIREFAGEPIERAKYYPEDRDFLLEFEPHVVHYEVVGQSVTGLPDW